MRILPLSKRMSRRGINRRDLAVVVASAKTSGARMAGLIVVFRSAKARPLVEQNATPRRLRSIFFEIEGIYGARRSPLNDSRGILRSRQVIYEGIYGRGLGHLWREKGIYGKEGIANCKMKIANLIWVLRAEGQYCSTSATL